MFTRAIQGRNNSVVYFSDDGRRLLRQRGTWTWRNNNPGNMRNGKRARSLGAIGVAGGFAVFPDYPTGRAALKSLLLNVYIDLSLFAMAPKYAPAQDKNDVEAYRKNLKQITGFDLKRKVNSLNGDELERLMDAIQQIEGFRQGEELYLGPAKKIVDVQRDKGKRITAYLVEDLGWLSPVETVQGIISYEIDGVVAERGGRSYVRTRPDAVFPNNLEAKGK